MSKEKKILSFDKDAEFYYSRFEKDIEQGKYLDALNDIRTAAQKEPEEPEFSLALAELYTEMELYEESNEILFALLSGDDDMDGDCIYGLGCNFMGMRESEKARECLETYVDKYSDGTYYYDAIDLLDIMDEDDEEDEEEADDLPGDDYFRGADEGKAFMDNGEFEKAAAAWEKVLADYPDDASMKNNLSLAYFCMGDTEKAIETEKSVLADSPTDVHACCNMVLFSGEYGDSPERRHYLDKLEEAIPDGVEDLMKIGVTYLEVGDTKRALEYYREALDETPYDKYILYIAAAAAVNDGQYADAINWLVNISRIDPDDRIATYYKNAAEKARDTGEKMEIDYNYQVPREEIDRRIRYLNSHIKKDEETLRKLWADDDIFRCTIKWALTLSDNDVKRSVLDFLRLMGDKKAEKTLRGYVLKREEPDEIKNDVFMMLRSIGAKQPYAAYLGGKYIEVRIGEFGKNGHVSASNMRVFERIIEGADIIGCKDELPLAVKTLEEYIGCFDKPPVMRNTNAWAAAVLIFVTLKKHPDGGDIANKLSASASSVERCFKMLMDKFGEELTRE